MAGSNPLQGNPDAKELKQFAGAYVRKLREAAGLTQQELARKVGMDYYTTISQIERGVTRIPPDKLKGFSVALQVRPRAFAMKLLSYYDPHMWELLNSSE